MDRLVGVRPGFLTLCFICYVNRLNLNENALGGSIPKELASLKELEYLDLSDNDFEGRSSTGRCDKGILRANVGLIDVAHLIL
jgi:hypothetical protein